MCSSTTVELFELTVCREVVELWEFAEFRDTTEFRVPDDTEFCDTTEFCELRELMFDPFFRQLTTTLPSGRMVSCQSRVLIDSPLNIGADSPASAVTLATVDDGVSGPI